MQEVVDTYFLDSNIALKEANKNNKFYINDKVKTTQICYYDGEKIENTPYNCVNVPLKDLVEYFSNTYNRFPSTVNISNSFVQNQADIDMVLQLIGKAQEISAKNIEQKTLQLYENIKLLKPNFDDEKLRVFISVCRETTVMRYVGEAIIIAFEKIGCETFLNYQENDLQACTRLKKIQSLYEFNPHITININHFENEYLNESIYNFVWFQDEMQILTNNDEIILRKRDFVFYLTNGLKHRLYLKNVDSIHQPFCIDEEFYKPRHSIEKKKKIVFIGTSTKHYLDDYEKDEIYYKILEEVISIFEEEHWLSHDAKEKLSLKYNKPIEYFKNFMKYLTRDYCIEKLCQIDTNFEIEIYGYGFENNPIIKPYYKGIVEYGEDVSKIYNSATYGFCPGGYVLMQRTIECAFSGTIPLVLDNRFKNEDADYDKKVEDGIEFFNIKDLEETLNKKVPKDKNLNFIKEHYSYRNFAKNCIDIIKQNKDN